jgi:hypothetical protein
VEVDPESFSDGDEDDAESDEPMLDASSAAALPN